MNVHVLAVALSYLISIASAGWVDPDTDSTYHSTEALTEGDDRLYQLVMSDEFEQEGRSFADGEDPKVGVFSYLTFHSLINVQFSLTPIAVLKIFSGVP